MMWSSSILSRMVHRFVISFLAFLAMQAASPLSAQTLKPPGPLTIERVADDLYMVSGEGGNVAVLVTDEGVILVDDMFDRNHADILAQVASVTDQPIAYVASGGYGHTLGVSIALSYLPAQHSGIGTELEVEILGDRRPARVAAQPLYDPENERLLG